MPPTEDYTALEQEIVQRESVAANEIVAYQRQIDALDAQIADASKIDEETQAAHDRRLKKVLDIKKSLSDHIDARLPVGITPTATRPSWTHRRKRIQFCAKSRKPKRRQTRNGTPSKPA